MLAVLSVMAKEQFLLRLESWNVGTSASKTRLPPLLTLLVPSSSFPKKLFKGADWW